MIKSKEKSLSVLIHELDGVFSSFIRLRDMKDSRIRCFVCGHPMSFNEAQCLHFINRDQMPTRYDEINCHAGCEDCNCFDINHRRHYLEKMRDHYGADVVSALIEKSKSLQKYMRHELLELIEDYKLKIKQLKK